MFDGSKPPCYYLIRKHTFSAMVEPNPDFEEDYQESEKNFLEEPAILDKYKAAAAVTDGK